MKSRLTKVLCLMLVLVMVFAMAVACGKKDDSKPNSGNNSGNNGGNGGNGGTTNPGETTEAKWYDSVDFGQKTLTIQLSNDAADPELPADVAYIQGPDKISETTGVDKVKNLVKERNRNVESKKNGINVKIDYKYTLVEGYSDRWSHVSSVIAQAERNYSNSNKADLYIDLMYDMLGAACEKAVFDNILKYTKTDSGVAGWVGGYFDIESYNGYNTALMSDMTLTEDRQVLIASDYFLDVLRAMLVLPFNLSMYTEYATDDADAAKLYQMVLDGKWTWDQLLSYNGVASSAGSATIDDSRILMAIANGGMMATGFLYSTDYTIYKQDGDKYTLKTTCSELQQLFSKAGTLSGVRGIVMLPGESAAVGESNRKFTSGEALFATVNMLGILETADFQGMAQGSLSILPVPKLNENREYSTLTNSRARVGALSYHSTNQAAMSAYIQLSTEESGTVKDTYFDDAILGKYLAGSGASTILNMIYNRLGNAKNAIIENLILNRDWTIGKDNCWAQLIKQGNMTQYQNISSMMAACVGAKQEVLNKVVEAWKTADVDVTE